MNCSDCRYSHPTIYDAGPTLECHRNPPQTFALTDEVSCGWPSVEENDWCGEHKPVPEPTELAQGPGDPR